MKPIHLITLLYIALIILIIYLADQGILRVAALTAGFPYGDKLGHFLLIGCLAFFLNLSLACRYWQFGPIRLLRGSLIILSLAALEEVSQYFIPARSFDWGDLSADLLGVLVFGYLAQRYQHRQRPAPVLPD